jgi:hypothetical protein
VASGAGYAILIMNPHTDRAYDGSLLVSRPIRDPLPSARYGLAMAKDYSPRRIVQAFIEVCRMTLKDEGAAANFSSRNRAPDTKSQRGAKGSGASALKSIQTFLVWK